MSINSVSRTPTTAHRAKIWTTATDQLARPSTYKYKYKYKYKTLEARSGLLLTGFRIWLRRQQYWRSAARSAWPACRLWRTMERTRGQRVDAVCGRLDGLRLEHARPAAHAERRGCGYAARMLRAQRGRARRSVPTVSSWTGNDNYTVCRLYAVVTVIKFHHTIRLWFHCRSTALRPFDDLCSVIEIRLLLLLIIIIIIIMSFVVPRLQ